MISVEEAQKIVLTGSGVLSPETCALRLARGRILAGSVHAPQDQPPWDNSAMDGYAVRWEDVRTAAEGNPVSLKVIEVIPAGQMPRLAVQRGECAKIMTGASVPQGADTIVPVEMTKSEGGEVLILKTEKIGEHVRLKGEDVRKGSLILKRGKRLRPAEIAMLASLGKAEISVFREPAVAILSTGDELAELDEAIPENRIFNSNGYALCAQTEEAGGKPLYLGISPDTKAALLGKIREGADADILVVSGGVSMGDFDYVREVLMSHGKVHFWRAAMRPGSPVAFGEMNGKPFFGLPGNPVSCMVTFKLFVEPLIRKMGGEEPVNTGSVTAVLESDIRKKKGMRSFLRGVLYFDRYEWKVRLTGEQGSHLIHSMVEANCLIDIPEELDIIGAGTRVSIIPL